MKNRYLVDHMSTASLRREVSAALPRLLPSCTVLRMYPRTSPQALAADVLLPSAIRRRLRFDVTPEPTPSRIREPLRRLKASLRGPGAEYPMLASRFLSPRVRAICREEGVGYLDLAGNCFLSLGGVHVEKIVERNPFPRRGRPASLFAPVSSRVARALLEEPKREWTVSALAETTGMSLGQASNVARRLLEEEYLDRAGRRLRLRDASRLLEAWRDVYTPALHASHGGYSLERDPQRRLAKLAEVAAAGPWPYAVTSFAAASLVAPFVHGVNTLVWYVERPEAIEAWTRALDLRPVDEGANAILLVPNDPGVFHRSRTVNGVSLVGDVQLYLDLYADAGRGREQAEFLRQQRLGW